MPVPPTAFNVDPTVPPKSSPVYLPVVPRALIIGFV